MNFKANDEKKSAQKPYAPSVPFFEDSRSDLAPYYGSKRSTQDVTQEILEILGNLGGRKVKITDGVFEGELLRHGYVVEFVYAGETARVVAAGLPIRIETDAKIERVRLQALLIVKDQLKAALTAIVFSPGSYPLMQYVVNRDTNLTIGETFAASKNLLPERVSVQAYNSE